jgi:hypothetical protein
MANQGAKTLGDLVTSKQIGMIRGLCREVGTDAEGEAEQRFGCKLEELSKRQASAFIEALKDSGEGEAESTGEAFDDLAHEALEQQQEQQEQQQRDKEPRAYARPIAEILADLRKPLLPRHLKRRKQGGTTLIYIEWHTAVKYLDHFAPGWSYYVKSVQLVGSLVSVVASISIPCAEGIVTREATGCEEADTTGYGDACSNAEAMALKRAAAKFGLGLYLYCK